MTLIVFRQKGEEGEVEEEEAEPVFAQEVVHAGDSLGVPGPAASAPWTSRLDQVSHEWGLDGEGKTQRHYR